MVYVHVCSMEYSSMEYPKTLCQEYRKKTAHHSLCVYKKNLTFKDNCGLSVCGIMYVGCDILLKERFIQATVKGFKDMQTNR